MNIMSIEINQTEKKKYCMISLRCGIKNSQTHSNKECNTGCQGLEEGWEKQGHVGRNRVPTFSFEL